MSGISGREVDAVIMEHLLCTDIGQGSWAPPAKKSKILSGFPEGATTLHAL